MRQGIIYQSTFGSIGETKGIYRRLKKNSNSNIIHMASNLLRSTDAETVSNAFAKSRKTSRTWFPSSTSYET